MDIGKRISTLRRERGWTQAQLAEKLVITDKAVSKWEQGRGDPELSSIVKLSEVFGVTTDCLLIDKVWESRNVSGHGSSSPISVVAEVGEWFRFTVECYVDASGNNMVRFFVDGQQVGGSFACNCAPSSVTRTRIVMDANRGANLYFDNTKVEFLAQ